jgi:hypothetical protein
MLHSPVRLLLWLLVALQTPVRGADFIADMCAKEPLAGEMCVPFWPKRRSQWSPLQRRAFCRWRDDHSPLCAPPTAAPTRAPTRAPTAALTAAPTAAPTPPTPHPTGAPTPAPTPPTPRPTGAPTLAPTPYGVMLRYTQGPCRVGYRWWKVYQLCFDLDDHDKTYAVPQATLDALHEKRRQRCADHPLVGPECVQFWSKNRDNWDRHHWQAFCSWQPPRAPGCAPYQRAPTPAPAPTPSPIAQQNCPLGKFERGAVCTSCSPGKFQARRKRTNCDSCPAGKFTHSYAAHACRRCPAGQHQGRTGTFECKRCAAGRFVQGAASGSCRACAPDHIAAKPGSAQCQVCPAGFATRGSGRTQCWKQQRATTPRAAPARVSVGDPRKPGPPSPRAQGSVAPDIVLPHDLDTALLPQLKPEVRRAAAESRFGRPDVTRRMAKRAVEAASPRAAAARAAAARRATAERRAEHAAAVAALGRAAVKREARLQARLRDDLSSASAALAGSAYYRQPFAQRSGRPTRRRGQPTRRRRLRPARDSATT